jgi:HSP20 family molecular chaperone IbpA
MIYLLDDPLFQNAMADPYQMSMPSPGPYNQGMFQGMHMHPHRHRGKMPHHGYADPWSLMPSMFDAALAMPMAAGAPNIDIKLDKENNVYLVEAQTPGVKRDELKIEIVGRRTLEVSIEKGAHDVGQREKREEEEPRKKGKAGKKAKGKKTEHQQEEGEPAAATNEKMEGEAEGEAEAEVTFKFFGRVTLPEDADTTKTSVEYADGLLRLGWCWHVACGCLSVSMLCLCVCARARARRACVYACLRVCVCVWVCVFICY